MNKVGYLVLCLVISVAFAAVLFLSKRSLATIQNQASPASASLEDAYRANNLGVALMEQFKYKEAADTFKHALQLDPKLALAHINLSIALYYVPDLPASQREAQNASALVPDAPQTYYLLGLIAKQQTKLNEAISAFQQVLKIDPNDVGA